MGAGTWRCGGICEGKTKAKRITGMARVKDKLEVIRVAKNNESRVDPNEKFNEIPTFDLETPRVSETSLRTRFERKEIPDESASVLQGEYCLGWNRERLCSHGQLGRPYVRRTKSLTAISSMMVLYIEVYNNKDELSRWNCTGREKVRLRYLRRLSLTYYREFSISRTTPPKLIQL